MSAVSKRVYQDWQDSQVRIAALIAENARLRTENGKLVQACRLAYLEGLYQGRKGVAS